MKNDRHQTGLIMVLLTLLASLIFSFLPIIGSGIFGVIISIMSLGKKSLIRSYFLCLAFCGISIFSFFIYFFDWRAMLIIFILNTAALFAGFFLADIIEKQERKRATLKGPSCSELKQIFKKILHEGFTGKKFNQALKVALRMPNKEKLRCLKKLLKKCLNARAPQEIKELIKIIIETERTLSLDKMVEKGQLEKAQQQALCLKIQLSPIMLRTIFDKNFKHSLETCLRVAELMSDTESQKHLAKLFQYKLYKLAFSDVLLIIDAMPRFNQNEYLRETYSVAIMEGEIDLMVDLAERLGIDVEEKDIDLAERIKAIKMEFVTRQLSPANPSWPF